MTTPADTLRQAIAKHGLSQQEAAAKLEISESYLSDILNKRRSISANIAVRAEAILGVSAQKILVDQMLVELERAKMDYAAERKVTA